MMKIYCFLILFAVSFSTAMADVIMTVDRKIYYDVEFAKIDINGMQIFHRGGIVTLTPDQFNRYSKQKYAHQILEYESVIKKQTQKIQLELDKKIKSLKYLPVDKRLSGYADLRIFYTSSKFSMIKLDFSTWEQEVVNSHRELDEKIMDMDMLDAVLAAAGLKDKFARINVFTDKFNAVNEKIIAVVVEDLPQIEDKIKTMKPAQRIKTAQTLFNNLKNSSANTAELQKIISNARGEIEIRNAINQFKNSRDHFGAIQKFDSLIARYTGKLDLSQAEQMKNYHAHCQQAKDDFDYITSHFDSRKPSDSLRIMGKALRVYADTPYAAVAKTHLKDMEAAEKKSQEEEKKREAEWQHSQELRRQGICQHCMGSGKFYNGVKYIGFCNPCAGTGRVLD